MNNNNALVALAFIKETDNPYDIFCKFITYCLNTQKKSSQLSYEKLKKKMKEEFGLEMPFNVYNTCFDILKRKGIITQSDGFYKLLSIDFNIKDFELTRMRLKQEEVLLLTSLEKFANLEFGMNWNSELAKKYLNEFLTIDNNASTIFIGDFNLNDNYEEMTAVWIVQQFVKIHLDLKDDIYSHLREIVNGLMIYIGVYYSNDATEKITAEDTDFYFDTKLVLRFLGYSSQVYIDAVNELINIIKEDYKGNLCVFKHTIGEVASALYNASMQLKSGIIEDNELMNYYILNKPTSDDLRIYSESVEYELLEHGFRVQGQIDWEDKNLWSDNLDIECIEGLIKKLKPNWKYKAIENDVYAMNQINMFRKSDYSEYFGGVNKLPVFITTNYTLIQCIKRYINDSISSNKNNKTFNRNISPFISDNSLMCKLWLQLGEKRNSVVDVNLSLNAHAILPYDNAFFNRMRDLSSGLKDKYKYKIFNLDVERQLKLEQNLAKLKITNMSDLNEEDVVFYLDESQKIETENYKKEIERQKKVEQEKDIIISDKDLMISDKEKELREAHDETIKAYSSKYMNKLGANRGLIFIAETWYIIIAVLILAISSCLNLLTNKNIGNSSTIIAGLISFVILLFPYILKIIEKLLSHKKVEDKIKNYLFKIAKDKYKNKIIKKMSDDEIKYQNEIIEYCLNNTKCFKKYSLVTPMDRIVTNE